MKIVIILGLALLGALDARHIRKHHRRNVATCKVEDITAVDVDLSSLSGVWFKVLHKYTPSSGKTSYTLKNEVDGDKLTMTEYYMKDDNCEGPITGEWTKPSAGKIHLKITVGGTTHETTATVVYHHKHPRLNNEEVLAFYACKRAAADGTCPEDKQIGAVLSRSRHPQASSLFRAARALQTACLNPKTLVRLNTFTTCGNQLLEEGDQYQPESERSSEESSEEEEEETPDRCLVDNINGIEMDLEQLTPATYYMIATHDGFLTKQGVTMMNIEYKGEKIGDNKIKTYMKLIKHGVCYKGELEEWIDPEDSTVWRVKSNVRTPAGPMTLETPMKMVYSRNGIFIAYWCKTMDPVRTGRCQTPRVGIWTKRPLITVGELALAFVKLRTICVEPRHMIFMNTNARCNNPFDIATHEHQHTVIAEEDKCKVSSIPGTDHFTLSKLEGVWYVAAGIGVEALHPHIRSAVIKRTTTDDANVLRTEVFVNLVDGTCISMTGTMKLISAEDATVEHEITGTVNGEEKTLKHQSKVLHAGSQLVIFYHCQEENADGTCKAPLIRLDSRTREIRHRDIQNIERHSISTCANPDSIRWFFMHSQCGKEFDPPFNERHGFLALSHSDTMDIITKFSSPMCKVSDIKGQNICMKTFSEAGPWYSVAMYDAKWADFKFYGSIAAMKFTGNGSATGVEQAVFDAGDGKTCHQVKFNVYKEDIKDAKDVKFMGRFSMLGQEHSMHWKWVWTNYRLGVAYWCRQPNAKGECPSDKVSVYVTSNHESIDHAEWLLLEQIVRSLCVDPALLRHMTAHEICMIEHAEAGNKQYPPRASCDWDDFKGLPFTPEDAEGVYHTMAYASRTGVGAGLKSRSFRMEKQDDDNIKMTMKSSFTGNDNCEEKEMILTRGDQSTNEWKTSVELDGEDTPVSIWLGHSVGPYTVLIGCTGEDCDEKTGFVFIESHYRSNDKMAIQETYQYLQDNCIDADMLTRLDSHSECGAEIDTRSCRVTDFQGLSEYSDEGFTGVWYLVVHTNERYASLKCKAEPEDAADGEVKVTCYAKMGDRCVGPSEAKFTRDEAKPGQVQYVYSHGRMSYSQHYHLLYQDNNHLLMVGCKKLSGDGSCLASRTTVMIWSKQPSIESDNLPEELLEKLDGVCVHTGRLEYLSETDCGATLE